MKKLIGLSLFLLALYAALLAADPGARTSYTHINLARDIGLQGVVGLGAGLLIISGGIDLSIGAVVGLSATALAMLLRKEDFGWHPAAAMAAVLAMGVVIGLIHGLLVTKTRLQAFVVTLCGLFVYRGLARWLANDSAKSLSTDFPELKQALAHNRDVWGLLRPVNQVLSHLNVSIQLPVALVILLLLAGMVTVLLHFSVYGRYLYAIGSNETAARYSGIAVDRHKLLAYALCSTLAAGYGILYLMENNGARPSETGNFLELYAIAAAVLGGCSLRGGEGTVLGMVIGTTILWILPRFTRMWGIPDKLEFTVIGLALLLGASLDELLRRKSGGRVMS